MIRILCPVGKHLIAKVDIAEGHFTPRGLPTDINPDIKGPRHGLSWDYAPSEGHSRVRATCLKSRCTYDASCDYMVLAAKLAAAEEAGRTEFTLDI